MTNKTMLEALEEVMRIARAKLISECNAEGKSGNGHNADWCAGWNAHNLQCAQDSNRLKAMEQAMEDVKRKWRADVIVHDTCMLINMRADEIMREMQGAGDEP